MATSEGIPSSIDIEFLELNDNPYFTSDSGLTSSQFWQDVVPRTKQIAIPQNLVIMFLYFIDIYFLVLECCLYRKRICACERISETSFCLYCRKAEYIVHIEACLQAFQSDLLHEIMMTEVVSDI